VRQAVGAASLLFPGRAKKLRRKAAQNSILSPFHRETTFKLGALHLISVTCRVDVCFTPESRRVQRTSLCPLRAKSGHDPETERPPRGGLSEVINVLISEQRQLLSSASCANRNSREPPRHWQREEARPEAAYSSASRGPRAARCRQHFRTRHHHRW